MEQYETQKAQIGDIIKPYKKGGDYVVIEATMEGGGTGHGPHDIYPDGWHVEAQLLDKNGNYNPDGKKIDFYQSGCFNNMIEEVQVTGKMERTFVKPMAQQTIYHVTTEGDCEGRSTRTVGYAVGDQRDIELFFDDKKYYKLSLNEVSLTYVRPESVAEKREILDRQAELLEEKTILEQRLGELEKKLQ